MTPLGVVFVTIVCVGAAVYGLTRLCGASAKTVSAMHWAIGIFAIAVVLLGMNASGSGFYSTYGMYP